MRPEDVRKIIAFNTRMGMFVCPSCRENVVAFLHGYEHAADGCRFTDELSRHVAARYRIKPTAGGWPDQVERLAERRSLTWMEAYFLLSSHVLSIELEGGRVRAVGALTTGRKPASLPARGSRTKQPPS